MRQRQAHGQKDRRTKGNVRSGGEVWASFLIALPTATAALRATADLQPGEQQLQSRL